VFAVIVFDAGVPGKETIATTVVFTVLLSIIAHGATANPLIASPAAAELVDMQRPQ